MIKEEANTATIDDWHNERVRMALEIERLTAELAAEQTCADALSEAVWHLMKIFNYDGHWQRRLISALIPERWFVLEHAAIDPPYRKCQAAMSARATLHEKQRQSALTVWQSTKQSKQQRRWNIHA